MVPVFFITTILILVIQLIEQFHVESNDYQLVENPNRGALSKERIQLSEYSNNHLYQSDNHRDSSPCADGMCLCTDIEAVCSNHGRQLFFVPILPKSITMLYYYNNYLYQLTSATFSNLTDLELNYLYIGNNSVQHCEANIFNQLTYLETLIINDEQFSTEDLKQCLSSISTPSLRELDLVSLNFYDFPMNIFSGMANSSLEQIVLSDNNIGSYYDQKIFSVLKKLESVSITSCGINETKLVYSETMKSLSLKQNNLDKFPIFCSKIGQPVFPNLMEIQLNNNFIEVMSQRDIECLTNLRNISISDNPIKILEDNIFSRLPYLITFHFDHITYDFLKIERFAFNSSSLISLFMRDNEDSIVWLNIDTDVFKFCPKLETLDLLASGFGDAIGDDFLSNLFSPLTNLKILVISNTGIRFIPRAISKHMTNLVELHANYNNIIGWSDGFFTPLTSLNKVYLQHNQIETINQESFPDNTVANLKFVSLAFNPFACSCDLLWFKQMLSNINYKTKIPFYPEGYVCNSPLKVQNQLLIDIKLSDQICLLSKQTSVIIISTSSALLLLIICSSLVYRYRWYLRFAVYMIRFHRRRHQRQIAKPIDAYISCSEEDFDLILDEIVPKLETECGRQLYIPQRDGIGNKLDEIINNMDASRKAILFVSNSYACDNYCEFEATLAYDRYLNEKRDFMIIILLEEIDALNVTKTLHMITKNCEYIHFGRDEESSRLFWIKLTKSIDNMDDCRP